MKNPNSPWNRLKKYLSERWSAEDYPGAQTRFQFPLFAKDVGIFVLLPLFAVIIVKSCESSSGNQKRQPIQKSTGQTSQTSESGKSQIIDFRNKSGNPSGSYAKRSPGTLVKVRLLNVVETYSNAPVHAQIIDNALGRSLLGGTIIGDAVSDPAFEKINITFKYARDPNREGVALPISARALGLDGTLGINGKKKEGFFARSALGSGVNAQQNTQGGSGSSDFKEILFRALASGFAQEMGSQLQVERNRAQVLTLQPPLEFYVELIDFFPGSGR